MFYLKNSELLLCVCAYIARVNYLCTLTTTTIPTFFHNIAQRYSARPLYQHRASGVVGRTASAVFTASLCSHFVVLLGDNFGFGALFGGSFASALPRYRLLSLCELIKKLLNLINGHPQFILSFIDLFFSIIDYCPSTLLTLSHTFGAL